MIVVDTNVLARIIVNDEPAQAARATAFLRVQDRVLIPKTVVLELEWVLRATYRLTRETISAALRQILDFANAEVEDTAAVSSALQWYEQGLDFADSLHLASGRGGMFATFDGELRRRVRRLRLAQFAEF